MALALLLGDDRPTLEALAEVVSREGLETHLARTVAEAVEALREQPPDVIITDLMLPDGRGLELIRHIPPPCDPEVILITGHATEETAAEALRCGVFDYLTKPVDLVRLQTVLTNAARTRDLKNQIRALRDELRRLWPLVERSPGVGDADDSRNLTERPSGGAEAVADRPTIQIPVGVTIAEAERQLLFATLDLCGGNKQRAAHTLGVSLKTLYNRLNSYDRQ